MCSTHSPIELPHKEGLERDERPFVFIVLGEASSTAISFREAYIVEVGLMS